MPRTKQILSVSTALITDYCGVSVATGLMLAWFEEDRFGAGLSRARTPWMAYISLPLYLSFLLLRVVTLASTLEFDLYFKDKFGSSEITQDLVSFALAQFSIFSYFLLSSSLYPLHLCLISLFSAVVTFRHIQHLPYYDYLHNALFIWSRGSLATSSFALLIGHLLGSEESGFLVMIALTLSLFCIIMLAFPDFQIQKCLYFSKRITEQTDNFARELGLRHLLNSAYFAEDKGEKLLNAQLAIDYLNRFLSDDRKTDLARLLLIKHLVLCHTFENERSARMCLCQTEDLPASLYVRFLLIRSEWLLNQTNSLEEIQFLRYLKLVKMIRVKDEAVCVEMSEVWNELGSAKPNLGRVIMLSKRIRANIVALKEEFQLVMGSFPGTFEIYDLYASFQEEVLSKLEEAKVLNTKAAGYKKELYKGVKKDDIDSIGFFDFSTAIILVDLQQNRFGEVIYMNSEALKSLKYEQKDIQQLKLTALIPPPYSSGHSKMLRAYVKEAAGVSISHPTNLPLLKSDGTLLFSLTKLLFTSVDGQPVLTIAYKPMASVQSGAILSSSMHIETHTDNFGHCIGSPQADVRGQLLTDIRPSIARIRAQNGVSPCFQLFQNRPFCAIFAAENYSNKRLFFLLTFESLKESSKWDLIVSDIRSSLYVSSNLGSDQRANTFFLSDYQATESEKMDKHSPFTDDLNSKNMLSGKESSTSDLHSRERTLIKLNKMLLEGYKACSLIAILIVSFMQIFALVVLNIVVAQVIFSQVKIINSSDTVVKVSAKQVFVAELAFSARVMSTPEISSQTKSLFISNFEKLTTSLQDLQAGIWSEIEESKSVVYEEFFISAEVLTWELLAGEVVERRRTLIDAMQKLLDEVSSIQSVLLRNTVNQTFPISSVFYLYRNGLGETYHALHHAKLLFLTSTKANINQAIDLYFVYILTAFGFASIFTFLSIPVLRKLKLTANDTSQLLYLGEIATYYEEKRRVIDRLSARYEVELDPAIEHPARGRKESRDIYHPEGLIIAAWGVLWILLIGFYFPFYFNVLNDLAFQMELNPQILSADSARLVGIIESNIWASEVFLASMGLPYSQLVPSYSLFPDPGWMITPQLSKIRAANQELLKFTSNSFEVSSQHFDFLHRNTDFNSTYFHTGYRPGIKNFLNEIIFCSHVAQECPPILVSLYQTSIELVNNVYLISDLYEKDCTDLSIGKAEDIGYMLNCLAVGLVLGLAGFLLGLRQRVYHTGKALLKLAATMRTGKGKERGMKESSVNFTRDISS